MSNLNDNDSYLLREQLLNDERFVHEAKMNLVYAFPEEPANEDLEKEIGLYTTHSLLKKRNHDTGVYHLTQKDCDDIARYFAEWQKQQMIKKVVEWLNSNTVTMKADHCEYTASSYNLRKEKFIIAFKLAMEE